MSNYSKNQAWGSIIILNKPYNMKIYLLDRNGKLKDELPRKKRRNIKELLKKMNKTTSTVNDATSPNQNFEPILPNQDQPSKITPIIDKITDNISENSNTLIKANKYEIISKEKKTEDDCSKYNGNNIPNNQNSDEEKNTHSNKNFFELFLQATNENLFDSINDFPPELFEEFDDLHEYVI